MRRFLRISVTLPIIRCLFSLLPRLERIPSGLYLSLFHEVTDKVQPFTIPAQHPRPYLEGLVRLDFPLEMTCHTTQHWTGWSFLTFVLGGSLELVDSSLE